MGCEDSTSQHLPSLFPFSPSTEPMPQFTSVCRLQSGSSWWAFSFSSKNLEIWSDVCTAYSWNSWKTKYRRLCNWVSYYTVHHSEGRGCYRPLLISIRKWGHCEARALTAAQLLHLSLSVFTNQNGESVKIQKTLLWRIFEESGTQFKENFSVFHHELLGNFSTR